MEKGNVVELKSPKAYALDWSKVKTIDDVVLLLKLVTGSANKEALLYLHEDMVDDYKHLIKDSDLVEGNL